MRSNIYDKNFPERSKLYNIEPIGIGTSMVESLTSYITRLSHAHNVTVKNMLQFVIFPMLQKNKPLYLSINNYRYSFSRNINGTDLTTLDFINALEKLTSRNDLSYLTLISWKGIATEKSIGNHKKWCPHCLNAMQRENTSAYQPLLWNLRDVTICPLHNTPLERKCPKCDKLQLRLSYKGNIANCQSCKTWLGGNTNFSKHSEEKINEFTMWVAESCGELLKVTPKTLSFPTRYFGRRLLEELQYDSQIFLDDVLLTEINDDDENSKFEIVGSLIYNLSALTTCRGHGNLDYFNILLKLIFFIGAPIQILYDYSSFNVSSLPIYSKLQKSIEKTIRLKQLKFEFENKTRSFSPNLLIEELNKIKGEGDELLVTFLETFLEDWEDSKHNK